jgi:hypothetical protein
MKFTGITYNAAGGQEMMQSGTMCWFDKGATGASSLMVSYANNLFYLTRSYVQKLRAMPFSTVNEAAAIVRGNTFSFSADSSNP